MVEQLGNDYSEIARSHWIWITLSVGVVVASSILGVVIGPELARTTIEQLLTTLITAVASILAIAFSVLFISTQIASERYSPGFTTSFVNDPIVQFSFGLGITSIVSNLVILTVSSSISQLLGASLNGGVSLILWSTGGFLLGLNVVFFLLLYPLIRLILIQTTPQNILSQFERQYDAPRFREEAKNAERVSNHPMQPVYGFARNAMKRGDYIAAISAVEILFEIPKNLLPELAVSDGFDAESIFKPILVGFGVPIISQADDTQFNDVTTTASEGMSELGREAIKVEEKSVFDEVFATSYSLVEDGSQLKNNTNTAIVACCSELYACAANETDILEEYIPRQSRLISIVAERDSITQLEMCLEGAAEAHNNYLPSPHLSNSEVEKVLLGHKEREPAWKRANGEGQPLLLKCANLAMQTTGTVLTLCDDTNPPGFVYEAWESMIKESHGQNADIHSEYIIRRYVELVVYTEIEHSPGISASTRISGLISNEDIRPSVLSACDSILNEDRISQEMNEFQFLERSLPEIWAPIPMVNYSDEFILYVEEIRDDIAKS